MGRECVCKPGRGSGVGEEGVRIREKWRERRGRKS